MTGEDGGFRLPAVRPGQHYLYATKSGFVRAVRGKIEVKEGEVTGGVDFNLERGGSIAGSILDTETGRPIGNAYINAVYYFGGPVAGAELVFDVFERPRYPSDVEFWEETYGFLSEEEFEYGGYGRLVLHKVAKTDAQGMATFSIPTGISPYENDLEQEGGDGKGQGPRRAGEVPDEDQHGEVPLPGGGAGGYEDPGRGL